MHTTEDGDARPFPYVGHPTGEAARQSGTDDTGTAETSRPQNGGHVHSPSHQPTTDSRNYGACINFIKLIDSNVFDKLVTYWHYIVLIRAPQPSRLAAGKSGVDNVATEI